MTAVDPLTEDGTEGHDEETVALMPVEEHEMAEDPDALERSIITSIRYGAEDSIRWPRHYVGPRSSTAFIAARARLAARGEIVFIDGAWRVHGDVKRGHFEPTRDEVRRRTAIEHASVLVALLEHVAWECLEYFEADDRAAFIHAKTCANECAYNCGGLFVVLPAGHVRRTS